MYKGSTARNVETTSESTNIEINEHHNNEGAVNNLDDNVAKFAREKQKEYTECVLTNNEGKPSNAPSDSYHNVNFGDESDENSLAFTCEEDILLCSVKNETKEKK